MIPAIILVLLVSQFSVGMPVDAPSATSDELRGKLRAHVHNYNLTANNFIEALTHVAREFQIPLGIAWVSTPAARRKLALSWKGATVQEILEAIAKTQPGYEVQ